MEVFATDNDPFMGVTVCQIANTSVKIRTKTNIRDIKQYYKKKKNRISFSGGIRG